MRGVPHMRSCTATRTIRCKPFCHGVQIAASATMSPSMVSSLQRLVRTDKPIPIATPFVPPAPLDAEAADSDAAAAERVASGAAAATSGDAAPEWGWGASSGFWANRTGAASNRGSAGGIAGGDTIASSMPPGLQHCYLTEAKRHHIDAVRRLLYALESKRAIVFMNHQQRLRDAMYKLAKRGLAVGVLHGEMGKQQRSAILDGFRSGKYQVVLVSDVVARGLDVVECDAVVHLEMPSNASHYAHRAGRTGRMGRPGVVVSIVDKQSEFVVRKLGSSLGIDIPACKVAGGRATIIDDGAVKILGRFEKQAALLAERAAAAAEAAAQATTAASATEGEAAAAASSADAVSVMDRQDEGAAGAVQSDSEAALASTAALGTEAPDATQENSPERAARPEPGSDSPEDMAGHAAIETIADVPVRVAGHVPRGTSSLVSAPVPVAH